MKRILLLSILSFYAIGQEISPRLQKINDTVFKITEIKPEVNLKENASKIIIPKTDKVTIGNVTLDPFMGLASWIGFQPGKKKGIETMMMGDLALFEDEINKVIDIVLKSNISITSLHHHFFSELPEVYYMHIEGEGNSKNFATTIKKIFEKISEIRKNNKKVKHPFSLPKKPYNLKTDLFKDIFSKYDASFKEKDGMVKIAIADNAKAACGCSISSSMGVNSWAAFAGTPENSYVVGDLVMKEDNVQKVIKALRENNISVVAIHNHMLFETPRLIFVHFTGIGKAIDLAHAIDKALSSKDHK